MKNEIGGEELSRVWLAGFDEGGSSADKLAAVLQKTAGHMVRFYRRISGDAIYSKRWSAAVVKLELDRMERLLKQAAPGIGKHALATSGTGYFIQLPCGAPWQAYLSGTAIASGKEAESRFEPRVHQAVAAAVSPFYQTVASKRSYAQALAAAILEEDPERAAVLIRSKVRSKALKSIAIEQSGVVLTFRFAYSNHVYRNLLLSDKLH